MAKTSLAESTQELNKDVATIINAVANLTDTIFNELPHRRGMAGTKNVFGEDQKALDVWTNDVLVDALMKTGVVKTIVSEELGEPLHNPDKTGDYTVTLDPLDGSSNIESNNLFGTIVGVHKEKGTLTEGKNQVCAFYNLYGPITTLVYATKKGGVKEFVKHRKDSTDYFLSRDNMKLKEPGELMSIGGLPKKWTPQYKAFVQEMMDAGKKIRYGGAFVGDFNQILYYGGVFSYPSLADKPNGKLRLVIEANPMSFIITEAGGACSNEKGSVLEVLPNDPNQRTPIHVGNKDLIKRLEEIHAKH
jgi:fructose-1,6-bisphosphatase I